MQVTIILTCACGGQPASRFAFGFRLPVSPRLRRDKSPEIGETGGASLYLERKNKSGAGR